MMHWDMPYGKGLADWDAALLTDVEVENLFQQLNVINRARAHSLVLGCVWHDVGRMRTAMAANGYLDIHPLFVYKPMQNTSGMEWISAVETLVVGYKGGIKACNLTFKEIHPSFRHNLLFGHQVGPKRKYAGDVVGEHHAEKPQHGQCFGPHHVLAWGQCASAWGGLGLGGARPGPCRGQCRRCGA